MDDDIIKVNTFARITERIRATLSRPMYYFRDGTPILGDIEFENSHDFRGTLKWARLFEDANYKRVADSVLPNGVRVSTIWTGLDFSFSPSGPPVIFESMAFSPEVSVVKAADSIFGRDTEYHQPLDQWRYSTEEQAWLGHWEMCEKFFAGSRTLPFYAASLDASRAEVAWG